MTLSLVLHLFINNTEIVCNVTEDILMQQKTIIIMCEDNIFKNGFE